MLYAEIILPLAGPAFYTYSVPAEMEGGLVPGSAVSVGLGIRKIVAGIVWRLHGETPPYKKIKPVIALLFQEPLVSRVQMRLWEWISEYYMCSPGEVMRATLPALLKPSGFSEDEFATDRFRLPTVRMVGLSKAISDEEALAEMCEKLHRRAPKQYEALVEIGGLSGSAIFGGGEVARRALAADTAALAALQKKGIITITERKCRDFGDSLPDDTNSFPLPELSDAQKRALDGLREALCTKDVTLLFGVPSSGKSEVCFHAIAETLSQGRDVLLLLPEISLTTQFVQRVRRVFGERVVLYHSGLSDRLRAEAYLRLAASSGGSLVVGVRSSVLLPLPRLGLVVVDEEQDSSYKQHDPAPRYNARDTAIVLARLSGSGQPGGEGSVQSVGSGAGTRVILASATPSLETWSNALSGKYGLVELSERWGGTMPPEVIVSDTVRAAKRGERRSHFNKELSDRIGRALERGEQTILFQNRRGMAPFVECADCGYVPHCAHCGIPMTAHRNDLQCHYCGASAQLPSVCPSCRGKGNGAAGGRNGGSESESGGSFVTRGFGTEKIEEELVKLFPSARVARLDRDSAASEAAYARIISDFERGQTDILVGTQMVTKGLDFAGVGLVGVLNADNLVNHPDFRASERAYQLIAQVAGRAGRREKRGEVVIQTVTPESRLIGQASAGDFRAMAFETLAERRMYGYPPYSRLVSVMLRGSDRDILHTAARRFGELLQKAGLSGAVEILGPVPPVVERIKNEFALVFLLKVQRSCPMSKVRERLREAIHALLAESAFRGVSITPDADPQ